MSDLDDRTRALLGALRSGDDPDQADVDRVGKALFSKLAAAGALAATSVAAPQAAAATGLLGLKLVASGLVAGIALAGGAWLQLSKPTVPAATVPATRAAPSVPVREPAEPPHEVTATPAPAVALPASEPAQPKKAPTLNVEAEAKLLAEAQRALAAGRTGEALARLSDYDRQFPKGMLRIEADAARVLALCGAGRQTEGQAQARRFLHRYADSPQASRVERACGARATTQGAAKTSQP